MHDQGHGEDRGAVRAIVCAQDNFSGIRALGKVRAVHKKGDHIRIVLSLGRSVPGVQGQPGAIFGTDAS